MMRRRVGAALGAVLAALMVPVGTPATAAAGPVAEPQQAEVRTATSTAAVAADGTGTVTLYAGPVQQRHGAGWRQIDLTLAAGPDGTVRPVAGTHDLTLTPTGPAVRFAGGGAAALEWSTPLPAPRLDGHRATYPRALAGHDLVVEATRAGFVAALRRTDPTAAPVPPLALRRGSAGRAEVHQAGEQQAEPAVSRVVAAAAQAQRLPVPFDTTVQSSVLRSDLSGDPDLRVGTYDGTTVARALLTWDLAPLAGRPVAGARMLVHQDWAASCHARGWEIWSAPPAGPATRWAGQPVADRRWATSTDTRGRAGCAAGWTAVDVTALVRGWVAAGSATGSVQLRASDESDALGWKRLASAESPHVPRLEIQVG